MAWEHPALASCTHGLTGIPFFFHRRPILTPPLPKDLVREVFGGSDSELSDEEGRFHLALCLATWLIPRKKRFQRRHSLRQSKETNMSRRVRTRAMIMFRRGIRHLSLGKPGRLRGSGRWMPMVSQGRGKEESRWSLIQANSHQSKVICISSSYALRAEVR